MVLFSGSLYAMALTGITVLGAITPLGGLAFLAGWAMLFFAPCDESAPMLDSSSRRYVDRGRGHEDGSESLSAAARPRSPPAVSANKPVNNPTPVISLRWS